MGLYDNVTIYYEPIREMWMLLRGRETFYNENNEMREWETREEAKAWAIENLGVDPDLYYERLRMRGQDKGDQMRLF